jgi:hypothetical protein
VILQVTLEVSLCLLAVHQVVRASIALTLLLGAKSYHVVPNAQSATERAVPGSPHYLVIRSDQVLVCVSQMRA